MRSILAVFVLLLAVSLSVPGVWAQDVTPTTSTPDLTLTDARVTHHEALDVLAFSVTVDGIKGIYEAGSPEHPLPRLDRTVMEAVVDEVQNHNLWVAAHTSSAEEIRHVLATGGVRTSEHGAHQDTLSAETIEQMNAQDVILVPTLAVLDARTESADSSRAPLHTSMYNVRRAHEAGVSIGAGTDTQGPTMHFGRSLHRELELLVEAGLSPRDALRGATSRAARALHSDDLGRIAPGARADVLIVAGRPWRDIRDARNVRIVLKDGRVLVSEDET